jgi:hypothetical protein
MLDYDFIPELGLFMQLLKRRAVAVLFGLSADFSQCGKPKNACLQTRKFTPFRANKSGLLIYQNKTTIQSRFEILTRDYHRAVFKKNPCLARVLL